MLNLLFIEYTFTFSLNSRSASAVALATKPGGSRKNPFDDMPPFDPNSHTQNKQIHKTPTYYLEEEHFAVNSSMVGQVRRVNGWVALHNSYGKKIVEDRKNWSSKSKILDL